MMDNAEMDMLKAAYDRYVDAYRGADGILPPMMQLKYEHTMKVVANADAIADGERFSPEEKTVAVAAALLHDTGRYEQLKRYDTFQDSRSVDHAVLSHDIVSEPGWLDGTDFLRAHRSAILAAVLYHNRRELPEGLDRLTELAAHTVRDADKLDIFRVLEDQVAHCDWRGDSRAFWNLKVGVPPSPDVVETIRARRPVDYSAIRSLADFVIIQIGWMISGLHFATTRRLTAERGHLGFRRNFLHEIGGGPEVDDLCGLVGKPT